MRALAAGTELAGRFRLQRLLGLGGTAEVWAATDRTTGTEVALRVVSAPDEGTASRWLPTLRSDAERLRGLVHPGILRPLEVMADGNLVCVVLELADRGNLGSLRGAGYQTIVTAIRDVADALQYVHAQGLTHGDLKAGNVLRDAQGRWRLTDFGGSGLPESGHAVSLSTISPQQLDGAPPTVADDIYSLGALLHDLLAGHPPLHPKITPARIRSEVPARLGVDGAGQTLPVALTQLVAAMLEKSPGLRPGSLGTVRALLAEIATAAIRVPVPPASGGATVESLQPPRAGATHGRPSVLLVIGLSALLAGIAAVVFWLPRVVSERGPLVASRPAVLPALPSPEKPPAPDARAVADTALAERLRAEDAAKGAGADRWGGADWLEARRLADLGDAQYRGRDFEAATASFVQATGRFRQLAEGASAALAAALAEGQLAFAQLDQPGAIAAFERALLISPDDSTAKQGLARSQTQDEVLHAMADAAAREANGDLAGARTAYADALELDPGWAPARDAVARLDSARAANEFERSMAQGLSALAAGRTGEARTALGRALALRPGDPGARGALEQLNGDIRRNQLSSLKADAERLAAAERWAEAAGQYRAMLEIDPAVAAGKTGLATAESRADLHQQIEKQLANGDRFNDDAVVAGAQAVIRDAESITDPGPLLSGQVARLKALIAAARPVAVQFESDNLTSVVIHKVGKLGAFTSRTVELRPGSYVVVGTRDGYRDVRRNVRIAPDGGREPINVRCEEPI